MRPAKIIALLFMIGTAACAASTEEENEETQKVEVETESDTTTPAYGSTYNSNCFCLACVKYCDVDGKTTKSGTCC